MPTYTDITKVKAIIEVPANLLDATILAFIDDAHLVVSEGLDSKGLSAARLEMIERYIAAHYITVLTERGGLTSSGVDNATDTYGGPKQASGLAMTRFGQQAIALDPTGTLKAMASDQSKPVLSGQFRVNG